jgi:hypothetical protein
MSEAEKKSAGKPKVKAEDVQESVAVIGDNSETVAKYVVKTGDSVENILELDAKGTRLEFDEKQFFELDEKALRRLGYDNRQSYFVSKQLNKQFIEGLDRSEAAKRIQVIAKPPRILGKMGKSRLSRLDDAVGKGMHGTWKRPEETDDARLDGYEPVRDPKTGEIMKIGEDGKEELVAMQIPDERFEEHLQGVSELSRRQLAAVKGDIHDKAKQMSHKSRDGSETVTVLDMGEDEWA